jgi:hypothetical protein
VPIARGSARFCLPLVAVWRPAVVRTVYGPGFADASTASGRTERPSLSTMTCVARTDCTLRMYAGLPSTALQMWRSCFEVQPKFPTVLMSAREATAFTSSDDRASSGDEVTVVIGAAEPVRVAAECILMVCRGVLVGGRHGTVSSWLAACFAAAAPAIVQSARADQRGRIWEENRVCAKMLATSLPTATHAHCTRATVTPLGEEERAASWGRATYLASIHDRMAPTYIVCMFFPGYC